MKPAKIDYKIEVIQAQLEANADSALVEWQDVFEQARDEWQIDRARQLLRLLKSQSQLPNYVGILKFYEGTLLVNLGEWQQAQRAFEQALVIRRNNNDAQGELIVLNSLANLLRRSANTPDQAIDAFMSALALPNAVDANRIVLLNGLALSLYEKGELEQAQTYFQEVLEHASQIQNQELRASALHNLGNITWTHGLLIKAQEFLEEAQKIQQAIGDGHGEAETLNSLGLIAEGVGQWETALGFYLAALKKMEGVADFYGQAQVLANLGNLCSLKKETKPALEFLAQAWEIARELGDLRLQGQALTALGNAYRTAGDYANAESHLLRAVELKTKSGDLRSLKYTFLSLGATYQVEKQPDKALFAYQSALENARRQQDHRIETAALLNMGILAFLQNRIDEAANLLEQSKEIGLEYGYHSLLSAIFEQSGDLEFSRNEPSAAKILESYALALWHANAFNEQELGELIDRLQKFWIAHAEDGYVNQSIWFCESIVQLWKDAYPSEAHALVIERFDRLRMELLKMGQ